MSTNIQNEWIINRLDMVFKFLENEMEDSLSRYDEISETEINRIRGRRNNILSGLGIILTVSLGLLSVGKIEEDVFLPILIFVTSLGLGTFIVFNFISVYTESTFIELHNAILTSVKQVTGALGYFIYQTANSQTFTYQQIENWFLMSKALAGAMYISPIEALVSKKHPILLNPVITESLRNEGIGVLDNLMSFEDNTKSFQRDAYLQQVTLDFIDSSLKSYKELINLKNKINV